jgi:hypothetical protein
MNNITKTVNEDNNSIIFRQTGAIDYTEQINIELSLTEKEGFIKIHPLKLMREIHLNHILDILYAYFINITNTIPKISDENESLPIENRFTVIYYKCYNRFHHFHQLFGKYQYTNLTLEQAMDTIKTKKMDIVLPRNKYE